MFSISKKVLYPAVVVLVLVSRCLAACQAQSDQGNSALKVTSGPKVPNKRPPPSR